MSDPQRNPDRLDSLYQVNLHKREASESDLRQQLSSPPQSHYPAALHFQAVGQGDVYSGAATRGTRFTPVLLAVFAVAIAIVVAFAASSLIGGSDKEDQRATARSAEQSFGRTTSFPAGTPNPPSPAKAELSYENMRKLVLVHYADLPSNPRATWERLDPHFTSMTNWNDYLAFWSTIRSVTVDSVTPRGPDSVVARLTYVLHDGRSNTEDRWLRFVSSTNGLRIFESGRIGTVA